MRRTEAARVIQDAGGRYADSVTPQTALLVVGNEDWLRQGGPVTRSLQTARQLAHTGRGPVIVTEREFLARLGLEDARPGSLFTTAELARMLQIPMRHLRRWIGAGLVRPSHRVGRLCYFDFRQVASAKALRELRRAGATAGAIRRSLTTLRRWQPGGDMTPSQLQAAADCRGLMVRLPSGRLAEPSGQLRFDFERPVPSTPAQLVHLHREDRRSGEEWFQAGVQAEGEGRLEDAADAYHMAQLVDGPTTEVAFNMGNVLYALDRRGEAAERYMQALELDPEYPQAWNNLGNVLADLGRSERAVEAYERALEIDPTYCDVHYNLAEVLDRQGHTDLALHHWHAYLKHDPHSAWAQEVRARLARTAPGLTN